MNVLVGGTEYKGDVGGGDGLIQSESDDAMESER